MQSKEREMNVDLLQKYFHLKNYDLICKNQRFLFFINLTFRFFTETFRNKFTKYIKLKKYKKKKKSKKKLFLFVYFNKKLIKKNLYFIRFFNNY